MKHIIITLSLAAVLVACQNKEQGDANISPDVVSNPMSATGTDTTGKAYPKMAFYETSFEFGKIKQGEKVEHLFKFKNTGKADLVISSASGSCGCTIPQYSKQPIKSATESTINVVFNSEGKHGIQHKTVTIIANTIPNTTVINITGEVIAPEAK